MFEYIKGKNVESTPTYIVIENSGIAYVINVSLNTYTEVRGREECLLYIHQVIREDAHQLFGFATKPERDLFRMLISVSGVGANTARVMLSSLKPAELQEAIMEGNVNTLKSIKGIGAKSAERIIVDLRDKIGRGEKLEQIVSHQDNTIKEEALSALVMLGFHKGMAQKAVNKLYAEEDNLSVEDMVKKALKML